MLQMKSECPLPANAEFPLPENKPTKLANRPTEFMHARVTGRDPDENTIRSVESATISGA